MHFVAFPALTEAERVAGLAAFDAAAAPRDPRPAIAASGIRDATRVRFFTREDQPVCVVRGASGIYALNADDLTSARVQSERMAITIAGGHARRRGMNADAASFEELADYDQPFVSGGTRIPTVRFIASRSTTAPPPSCIYPRRQAKSCAIRRLRRNVGANYAGSVITWIYQDRFAPPHLTCWLATVWALSFAALVASAVGSGSRDIEPAGRRQPRAFTVRRVARVASLAGACCSRLSVLC